MKSLLLKFKEAALSVIPVMLIVLIISFTPAVSLTTGELTVFVTMCILLVIGVGLFNLGADLAMSPMGEHVGSGLAKTGKPLLLLSVCFAMGVLITVAEPDLSVLARQVADMVNGVVLIAVVGAGVGLFLLISVIRTLKNDSLPQLLTFFYFALFALVAVMITGGRGDFSALAFDSGGVTTGPITVPFIMALGIGISSTAGQRKNAENNFGSIALCSVGPVLAVVIIGIASKGAVNYSLPDYSLGSQLGAERVFKTVLETVGEVAFALALISAFFFILQFTTLKLPVRKLTQILLGIVCTFVGLVIFMTAVKIGFMPVGFKLGTELASAHPAFIAGFGFVIGMTTVLAEPAVHVLNKQVEQITGGAVSRLSMMAALSVGVGISIALSMIRMIFDFSILYYLIPGYIISLGLSLFVPGIYTAIAFDSGGVASGPLTSSFILPMAIGVCCVLQGEGKVPEDAFGIVAMVAMTPLIAIQVLGFRVTVAEALRKRRAMARILSADDEQIIEFG